MLTFISCPLEQKSGFVVETKKWRELFRRFVGKQEKNLHSLLYLKIGAATIQQTAFCFSAAWPW